MFRILLEREVIVQMLEMDSRFIVKLNHRAQRKTKKINRSNKPRNDDDDN
jgi:hypothetical protein